MQTLQMMRIAERLERIVEPATLKMAQLSRELRAKGIDVIDMSLGEPDFDTPQFIKDAAKKAIDDNWTHYPPVAGFLSLREAVCRKFKRDNHLDYTPDQIVVSTGAKQSIANAVLSLVNPGDEVVIPAPYWVSYYAMVHMAQGKPVIIPSTSETNFKISAEQLEEAITPNTRMFIFSSPCNPTGTVYTQDELLAFARVFEKYPQVLVVSDEIYEYINFIGAHHSIAHFDWMKDRTIVVNGMSKGYAMTGWRLGYIGAPKWIAAACTKMQGMWTSGTSSISQKAAEAALDGDLKPSHEMAQAFKARKEMVMKSLKEIPGLKVNNPGGAFYFFPDVSHYLGKMNGDIKINTPNDLVMYFLHSANVATVDGSAFGGESNIRISYANSEKNLLEGLKRIKEALAKLT